VRALVGSDLRACTSSGGFGLIKIFYGNAKLHYEANHQARSQTIEIGLHFEADRFTNARLLGAFRVHAKKIERELPGARLEEWDKGWTRIWEPIAYEELDVTLQHEVAERLARYINVLEPMLRDELPADVPWVLGTPRATKLRSTRTTSARRSLAPRKRSG
jgi:hypothetical protein